MFKKGFVFTGKWFTGKILVLDVLEKDNELKVRLQSDVNATDEDYWWFETWNLQVVKNGWGTDYFKIGYDGK